MDRKTGIAEYSPALVGSGSQTSIGKGAAGILRELGRLE